MGPVKNQDEILKISFGFGVGDIVLVSQLTCKFYATLTTRRAEVGKNIKELEDVLFGLKCALDHLGTQEKQICTSIASTNNADMAKMQRDLDAMIASCANTLTKLEEVFHKFSDAADVRAVISNAITPVPFGGPKTKIWKRLEKKVKVNWLKVRWDIERKSLTEYRIKI